MIKKMSVSLAARDAINEMLETDEKIKPLRIIENLERLNIEIPLVRDLNNYLSTLRKRKKLNN